MEENRYFVRIAGIGGPWTEVPKDQYLRLEEKAGFRSKEPGEPACASFSNECIEGTTAWPSVWVEFTKRFVPSQNVFELNT